MIGLSTYRKRGVCWITSAAGKPRDAPHSAAGFGNWVGCRCRSRCGPRRLHAVGEASAAQQRLPALGVLLLVSAGVWAVHVRAPGEGLSSCGSLCCPHSPTPDDGTNPCYVPCPPVRFPPSKRQPGQRWHRAAASLLLLLLLTACPAACRD